MKPNSKLKSNKNESIIKSIEKIAKYDNFSEIDSLVMKIISLNEEIIKREKEDKLLNYNKGKKIHEKQMIFHKTDLKNRWVFGGNRSGKSQCGAVEVVWRARGNHPFLPNFPDSIGWVVSLSGQVQRDVAQQKVLDYIDKRWIVDVIMISGRKDDIKNGVIDYILLRNISGGISRIGFKSCDQGREKFQGTSLDYVWFDEEPPKDIYDECKMRVLDKNGYIFGTMTPLKGLTWVYDTIYLNCNNDPQIWSINMEWADNPFLDSEVIASFASSMSPEELESRRFGKFSVSKGLVYPDFDPAIHIIEPFDIPYEWFDNMSIDPGLNNPLSCHWYAVDYDGNVYVIAEHYEANRDVVYHSEKIKDICKRLNWPTSLDGKYSSLIDSAANQRTLASSKSVSELFSDFGILLNTRVNKDLFSGINRVRYFLKDGNGVVRLKIFANCTNLIRELKGYFWGNNDAPIKRDDHALDELRYYIMSRPNPAEREKKYTEIELDKKKLIRKKIMENKSFY